MKADYSFCSIGLYYEEDFMIEEFKKFIMRGNVLDMAVGIIRECKMKCVSYR